MFDFFSPIASLRRISSRKAEKNISESYDYLINDFRALGSILESYYPLEVLKLSLWDERKVLLEKKKDSLLRARSVLLPVLLQSVLQSQFFEKGGKEGNISQKDWSRLLSLSDDVLRRIIRIIENRTSLFLSLPCVSDEDGEKYRSIIASYLIPEPVTENSLRDSSDTLRSLLEEKDGIEDKIGTDPLSLSINIDNIASRGLRGIDDLCVRVQKYSDEYSLARAQMSDILSGKSEEEAYRIITKKNGWEGRAENLAAERDGYDMFLISSSSSLEKGVFDTFLADTGRLDLISFLKMGYWISMRYPIFRFSGEEYTFVGKHMPAFIALTASFNRRNAALKSVEAIFYRTGIDTYTYDGSQVDISVLPSYFDSNLFMKEESYLDIRRRRDDESSVKTGYGHSRLIVDPDLKDMMTRDGDALIVSSLMMYRASVDRGKKKELITALLGELELPSEAEEYRVIDEDEIDRGEAPVFDDVSDDHITDEYEYATETDEEKELPEVPFVEYEKKNEKNIAEEEEKYALTDEIIRRDEEIEKEEEKFESALDDDIFDDTEEEERLDEIGEKEESDYYEEIDGDEIRTEGEDSADDEEDESADSPSDVQLDFFRLLDEDEEEKVIDDELEKEDEEEFRADEKKAEELDGEDELEEKASKENPAEDDGAVCNEDEDTAAVVTELPSDAPDSSDRGETFSDEHCGFVDSEEFIPCEEGNTVSDEEVKSGEEISLDGEGEESPWTEETEPYENADEEEIAGEEDILLDEEETEEISHFEEKEETSQEAFCSTVEENECSDEETAEREDTPLKTKGEEDEISEEESFKNETDEVSSEDIVEKKENYEADINSTDISPVVAEDDSQGEGTATEETAVEERIAREAEDEHQGKPLDVNSWMHDFIGDYSEDDESDSPEKRTYADESEKDESLEIEDDSFVLPRDGRIEGKIDETDASGDEKTENTESTTEAEETCPEQNEERVQSFASSFLDGIESAECAENEEDEKRQVLSMEELEEDETPLPLVTDDENEEEELSADGIIYDIYKKLSPTSVFASFVKSSDAETLEELESVIQSCWSRMQNEDKDKLFNVADYSFSILLSRNNIRDDLRLAELLNNAGGVMYSRGEEKWTAIILYINSDYILEGALEKTITRDSFSPSDWKRVTYIGEQMKKR